LSSTWPRSPRAWNLFTAAEFVENEETLKMLTEYGIDAAQGYHVGHPASAPGLAEHTGESALQSV
jgi:EAL domain-containing protein (putative c-di-GMP-specific phosphodiesterase class I)